MNKTIRLILIFALFSARIFAQTAGDISLELVTSKTELEPGKIHTIVYKIKNISATTLILTPGISLPADWKVISEIRHLTINAQSQLIMLVSFNIPAKYLAGEYTLDFVLVDPSNYENIITGLKSVLKVKEEPILNLELAESPDYWKAGEQISASYIIRNSGNTLQTITFSTFGCLVEGDQSIDLGPGQSSIVKVMSETDENISYLSRKSFYLEAKGQGCKSEPIYGFVRIVPVKEELSDLYHRLPVSLTTRYLAKGREGKYVSGYQVEVSGSGSIDPEGKHVIEFMGRGPNQFDMSLLGLYDEYSLSYSNKFMDLKLGDASYSMTPLTEYARYGTGVEQRFKLSENTRFGALFVKPRFYDKIKAEYGAYANISLLKKNSAGIYFLKKLLPGENQGVNLYGFTFKIQPFERTTIDLELSQGQFEGVTDNAYRVDLNSQFSEFSISAYYFHTGKNYPGYYTNSDFYSGYVNYSPTDWMSVGLSARQDFINAEIDTLFLSAPFSRQYQGSLVFKIGKRIFLKSYARQNEREDRSLLKKFHYETQSLNVSLSHRLKRFGYNIEGEFGKTTNFLLPAGGDKKNTFLATGNIHYNPNKKFYFQAVVSYSNIQSFISEQENNWIFGLTASANITKKLRTNLQLQNSFSIEDYYRNRNLFQWNIDYQFLKNHKLSANSYYTIFQNEVDKPEYSFMVSYSVNFGIPLKKVAEAGSVSGKIENLGVQKIKDVVLLAAGKSAVTDEYGKFEFKNLKPGKYNLLIDRTTVDLTDIPDTVSPIEITVEGNQETVLNFGLVKASKLSGSIEVEKTGGTPTGPLEESVIIGHVVLELHRENESIRIISDSQGHFSFPFVRPGKWFLKVFNTGIDKQYSFEKDYFDFDLQPGEQKDIVINLQKKKRNIIFLNNSINLSSGEK